MKQFVKRWRVAVQTLPIVLLLVAIKAGLSYFELEFITVSPLFTSIVAGGIFLFSLILAGTLSDYKESERLPAEFASSCESIHQEALCALQTYPSFDITRLRTTLCGFLNSIREDIGDINSRKALQTLEGLTQSIIEMEKLGVAPAFIVRVKNEQAAIRKGLMRFYYIQRINFLPSAYLLVQTIIVLIIGLLMFSNIEPFWDSIVIVFFLTYLFVYIIKLLRIMERPFQREGLTRDDVSLFLLEECQQRISSHPVA
jgi:hypothetical protein